MQKTVQQKNKILPTVNACIGYVKNAGQAYYLLDLKMCALDVNNVELTWNARGRKTF